MNPPLSHRMIWALFLAVWSPVFATAVTGKDILATFELDPGFQLELAAMEPVVLDPVDLEFDEQGRVFVLEMPGYPLGETPGRVVLVEDTDKDGQYDRRVVFAEGFPVASSLMAWRGGLLVANPPDLEFIQDTDGDNKADTRETLLSGFDLGNTQHNFNGLTYGLDNWIYASSGGNAGAVYWPGKPEETTSLRGNDLRFDLNRHALQRLGQSTGGFGLAFDRYGRIFGTHNMIHVRHQVFPGSYLTDKPGVDYATLYNVSDHEENSTSRIFPIGEQASRVNHPEESGYFSGACGITAYTGGAFGAAFENNIFVNDVVVNIVHHDVLQADGTTFRASRDRERAEFLASRDRAFRPVNAVVGPDGALYILDMHRVVIEHPEWIPDEIEAGLDLHAGMAQGRIFRIVPKGGLPRVVHKLDRGHLDAVVAALEHPNHWWRATAQRLLVEWQDPQSVELVRGLFVHSTSPLGRLHALWTLQGLGKLSTETLLAALKDEAPGVRENAAIIAEEHLQTEAVRDAVLARATDDDARVRLRATLALSTIERLPDVPTVVANIAAAGLVDPWQQRALLALAVHDPAGVLQMLLEQTALAQQEGAAAFLQDVAGLAGRRADAQVATEVLHQLIAPGFPELAREPVLAGLAEGLETRSVDVRAWNASEALKTALAPLLASESLDVTRNAWRLGRLFELPPTPRQEQLVREARVKALDAGVAAPERLEQIGLLELTPFAEREELLFELLSTRHPRELQEAAVRQLTAEGSGNVADQLIAQWRALSPPVREQAGNLLLRRRELHDRLLTALETGKITLGEMDFNLERRRMLLWWSDNDEVKRRAEKLFSDAGVVTRQAALEKMQPALDVPGDATRGHQVYLDTCSKCHIIGQEGVNVGPTLTDIFRKSEETLLHDIIDPNAAVNAEFISFTVETESDDAFEQQLITGMIISETDDSVTLREAGAVEHVIPRAKIKSMTSTGLSMMPEELEAGLSQQQTADLLAFLQQPR